MGEIEIRAADLERWAALDYFGILAILGDAILGSPRFLLHEPKDRSAFFLNKRVQKIILHTFFIIMEKEGSCFKLSSNNL